MGIFINHVIQVSLHTQTGMAPVLHQLISLQSCMHDYTYSSLFFVHMMMYIY